MENLTQLKTVTLAESVEDMLIAYIKRANLSNGDLLPKEEELSKKLDISRNILREGIARLKSIGIIESRKKKGCIVRKPETFSGIQKIFDANLFSNDDFSDFMELRVAIELGMCAKIYLGKNSDDIAKLRAMVSVKNISSVYSRDEEEQFHSLLIGCAKNNLANQFQAVLTKALNLVDFNSPKQESSPTHSDICDALENGSLEEFYTIMQKHLAPYQ